MNNIIALNPTKCSLIEIQTTIVQRGKINYLNTVNILFENKIIEKIHISDKFLENNRENIHQITKDYFISKLKPRKKKVSINKEKKNNAVSSIMEEFNLFKTEKHE
jgi:D-ribose pyranose/furanose isomerase RbsD